MKILSFIFNALYTVFVDSAFFVANVFSESVYA